MGGIGGVVDPLRGLDAVEEAAVDDRLTQRGERADRGRGTPGVAAGTPPSAARDPSIAG